MFCNKRGEISCQCIAMQHMQAARIMRSNLCKGRQATFISLNRDHLFGTLAQQGSCEATGARTNFNNRYLVEWSSCARDFARQVQIKQKVLPKRFLGGEIEIAHHITQGGKSVTLAHADWSAR